MFENYEFLKLVLDTLLEHIVVINKEGKIIYVNDSWVKFGKSNNCSLKKSWIGINYLDVCNKSALMGDDLSSEAAKGIKSIINGEEKLFYIEYPCHSNIEQRWFMMRVTPFELKGDNFYVISHENITERKLAENIVLKLSRIDGLTNIANRRYFDEFLNEEWKRCKRLRMPITLAIIDIDYFKLLNDTYGHQVGDDCLKKIGTVLKKFAKRPSDISARYGGEEFVFVFGNTTAEASLKIINNVVDTIRKLKIENKNSKVMPIVTVSIGLATMQPKLKENQSKLIKHADKLLYLAKENGRDRVVSKSFI